MVHAARRAQLFREYTRQVLAFRLGSGQNAPTGGQAVTATAPQTAAERAVRMLTQTGRSRLLVLGLSDGSLAQELAAPGVLPPDVEFTVCDADPDNVRDVLETDPDGQPLLPGWADPESRRHLLVDASPHALFLLLALSGYGTDTAVIMQNPTAPASDALRDLRRLLASAQRHPIPDTAASAPPVLAAILHPQEPALDEFFAQTPAWARQWVVTWDSPTVPEEAARLADAHSPAPIRHIARPLNGDFAAQRNACLDAVDGGHVLFLDGDERFDAASWALIPRLAAMDISGWRLPRRTFYPDADHCKIGYGLWPDMQLRLLRADPGVHFERPVHERAAGLTGPTAIAPAVSIIHLSRLLKSPELLNAKLAVFDRAGSGVRHRLAEEYPSLYCSLLDDIAASWHDAVLVLGPDRA